MDVTVILKVGEFKDDDNLEKVLESILTDANEDWIKEILESNFDFDFDDDNTSIYVDVDLYGGKDFGEDTVEVELYVRVSKDGCFNEVPIVEFIKEHTGYKHGRYYRDRNTDNTIKF